MQQNREFIDDACVFIDGVGKWDRAYIDDVYELTRTSIDDACTTGTEHALVIDDDDFIS